MQQTPGSSGIFELRIDETAKGHLLTMASWGLIIVIVAIIKYILSIIEFIQTRNQLSYQFEEMTVTSRSSSLAGLIITICIGLLINYFLYQFSMLTKKGINNLDQDALSRGFGSLRSYFAIIGILIIVALFFGGLAFLMTDMQVTS